jgi:hypothetical protein
MFEHMHMNMEEAEKFLKHDPGFRSGWYCMQNTAGMPSGTVKKYPA